MILGNLFSIVVFTLIMVFVVKFIHYLFRIPKCSKCGSEMVYGGWDDERLFCPNPGCKRYKEWSYE